MATAKRTRPALTQAALKEMLRYDPDSGTFTWIIRTHGRKGIIYPGEAAGFNDGTPYLKLGIKGARYAVHRLAWLYVHGVWPPDQIDHKDGSTENNTINNLRLATHTQNNQNRRRPGVNNKSGFLGVSRLDNGWKAQIKVNRQLVYLGYFDTPEKAHAAYLSAKAKLHPFQTLV